MRRPFASGVRLPDFITQAEIDAGRLLPLFCDFACTSHGIYMVIPEAFRAVFILNSTRRGGRKAG